MNIQLVRRNLQRAWRGDMTLVMAPGMLKTDYWLFVLSRKGSPGKPHSFPKQTSGSKFLDSRATGTLPASIGSYFPTLKTVTLSSCILSGAVMTNSIVSDSLSQWTNLLVGSFALVTPFKMSTVDL